MKIRNMVFAALFTAVICVLSPIPLPPVFGVIPLTLTTFAIYIAASTLNWKYGTLAVCVYILIGLIGVPVFSNFGAGVPRIVGPTGGFIIGYIPMALVTGLFVDKFEQKRWAYPVAMVLGALPLYACGTLWYAVSQHVPFAAALAACVVPFLIGDAIKIIAASVIAPILRKTLKKQRA
ncbi:biotin transport system substrate-specific component [Sporobacter termitidis DSM 10068]|uniref:Biotin transporter n=1 Tax=Sporobacter termitidis DSM 10068 TaxID=1123282 RepID=A0A1M5TWL4_9FIRM|nr:biotin transporter BioY [Sporobacter termitidis]SHH55215.1 biotin transport system substrate-specific component [Sporobacter termitidis DSM 10068]